MALIAPLVCFVWVVRRVAKIITYTAHGQFALGCGPHELDFGRSQIFKILSDESSEIRRFLSVASRMQVGSTSPYYLWVRVYITDGDRETPRKGVVGNERRAVERIIPYSEVHPLPTSARGAD